MIEQARWRALGTITHLLVVDGDISVARRAVERTLARVDATCSRFRPDSELLAVSRSRGAPVRVSPLMAIAIDAALRAARLTDGIVDPTVGRAVRTIGYDRDFAGLVRRDDPGVVRIATVPGWRTIRLDPATSTIRMPAGVELDLGSTGKALAADLAATDALQALGGRGGILVSLGGDIAMAGAAPAGGWHVLVAEDSATDAGSAGEVVALTTGGLATSSTTVRRWRRGATDLHHIVDPLTGLPAAGPWRTVSVVATTCVDANTAATAAIVRGETAGRWLEGTGLPARLVATDGTTARIGGWPEPMAAARPAGERSAA
jgi:thiamine biosynthesis lipoprotein ApbE